MKWGYQNKKWLMSATMFGFMMVTGTYNAVVINSESTISSADVKFVKRLDEVYGVIKPGREFASAPRWQKLVTAKFKHQSVKNPEQRQGLQTATSESVEKTIVTEVVAQAAIQEELTLNLSEVMNPKKWKQGLDNSKFSGSLSTRDGVIEELNISLPDGEGISVAFSEMTGNVFEYDLEGTPQTAMFYQQDQNVFKVNLTSGPLEGTILTFNAEKNVEQLAELEQHEILQQQNREEIAMTAEPQDQVDINGVQQYMDGESDPNLQSPEIQNAFMQDQLATHQAMNQAQYPEQEDYGQFRPELEENTEVQTAL